jgi:hypothetical protein
MDLRRRGLIGAGVVLMAAGLIAVTIGSVSTGRDNAAPRPFGNPEQPEISTPSSALGTPAPALPTIKPTDSALPVSTPAAGAQVTPAVPRQLVLPTQAVSADVEPVQTTRGALDVPANVAHVGWWVQSMPAGARSGTTVIDGHVDSATAGTGALFHLSKLRSGDPVVLLTGDSRITYRVYARGIYRKSAGLPADLFMSSGAGRLVIISCGGPFNSTTRSYEDNVVVFASYEL